MPLDFSSINWLAVLVATLAGFMLGGLWYGPLFGKAWLTAIGKQPEDLGSPAPAMSISFVAQLVGAIGMSLLIHALGIDTWQGGLTLGALIAIAFVATSMASDYAFCGWGVPLFLIQSGYRFAYLLIMAGIIAVWR